MQFKPMLFEGQLYCQKWNRSDKSKPQNVYQTGTNSSNASMSSGEKKERLEIKTKEREQLNAVCDLLLIPGFQKNCKRHHWDNWRTLV